VALAVVALGLMAAPPSQALEGPPDQVGQWGPVLDWGVQGKHMTLLHTGNVLIWSSGDQARIWNPDTGEFTLTPAPFGDVHCAGQVSLADGRIMVVGGQAGAIHDGIPVTSIFNPLSNTWTRGGDMAYSRWYPTLTTLPDGRALVTSGDATNGTRIDVPEIYDPTTDAWTPAAPRAQGLYPFMYVLPNGKVYEAGTGTSTALFDPTSGSWSNGPAAKFGSSAYSESGATYAPGKIMRAGGGDPAMNRTQVIDMNASNPQWQETAPMAFPRRRMNTPVLADGSIMAVGGTRQSDDVTQAVLEGEIWSPSTKQWTTVAAMSEARMYHSTALLLPDGRVVTAGGEAGGRLRAQVYSPPYLFKGPRPVITASPSDAAYGATLTVGTNVTDIEKVALIRPSAVTHAIDMNERYVPLAFSASGSTLKVDAPATANHAPPGYYMLVVTDSKGVPSVAKWVHLSGPSRPLPPPPVAAFNGSPVSGQAPLTVSFADATQGSLSSWSWDFDNNGTVDSTRRNPQVTYTEPGTYTVKLTVTNGSGTDDEVKAGYVTVDPAPGSAPPGAPPPPGSLVPQGSPAPPGSPASALSATTPPTSHTTETGSARPCKVPRLRGKTRSRARDDLADAGCGIAAGVTTAYSVRVRRGRVLRTWPAAGQRTTKRVRLVVSNGSRPHGRVRAVAASGALLCPLMGDPVGAGRL
jgi:PKD repeat protein